MGDVRHLLLALRWRIVPVVLPDDPAATASAAAAAGGATASVSGSGEGAGVAGVAALRVIERWALAQFSNAGAPAADAADESGRR